MSLYGGNFSRLFYRVIKISETMKKRCRHSVQQVQLAKIETTIVSEWRQSRDKKSFCEKKVSHSRARRLSVLPLSQIVSDYQSLQEYYCHNFHLNLLHFGLIFNPKPGITVRPPYPSKHAKIFFLLSNKILFVFMKYSLLLRGIFLHFKNYRNYTYFKSNQKSKVTNLFSFSKNVLLLLLLYFLFFQSINKRFIPKFQNINF